MDFIEYKITENDAGRRTDRVVRRFMPDIPISGIYRYLRKGMIRVNGKKARPELKIPPEGTIDIAVSIMSAGRDARERLPRVSGGHEPDILFLSRDLLFINKPRGIPVHGRDGLDRMVPPSEAELDSLSFRTGSLHRLDKGTSGIIAFSRTLYGAKWFTTSLSEHRMGKFYLGIVRNAVPSSDTQWIDTDRTGREMNTSIHQVCTSGMLDGIPVSLVLFRILTGRKHQIRIQASSRGCPLAGDMRYGGGTMPGGYLLHAWQLAFPADRPGDLPDKLTAPLPDYFSTVIGRAFGDNVLAKLETLNVY